MADSIPPFTIADLRATIDDPTWSVYLCVAEEHDRVWQLAVSLEGTFARHTAYRVTSHDEVGEWLPEPQPGETPAVAAVFGWGPAVFKKLTQAEAESRAVVRSTIRDARLP